MSGLNALDIIKADEHPALDKAMAQTHQSSAIEDSSEWYLVRTKTGGEKIARDGLQKIVKRTLLPLAKMQFRQQGRTMHRVGPVFPSYVFAFFSLASAARRIRYTPGVREIVRFGEQAAIVPTAVIDELIEKCSLGPVDFSVRTISQGSPIKVIGGPLRDFSAIFDGYLSGTDRVAVLLSLMNAERRAILPANMVIEAECVPRPVSWTQDCC